MHTHNPYSKCKVNRKVFKEKGGGTPGSFDRVEPFFPNAVMNLICSVPHSVKMAEFRSALEGLNISSHSEKLYFLEGSSMINESTSMSHYARIHYFDLVTLDPPYTAAHVTQVSTVIDY